MMATESAPDTELSVTLPRSLSEWLDERAATQEVDREELLLQLLGAYRTTAETDPDDLAELLSPGSESPETPDRRIDPAALDEVDERIEGVDAALSEHVEDLRSRILHLKDEVEASASADHDHAEIETLTERTRELSADLERFETDAAELRSELEVTGEHLETTEERLETVETKLDRLARVVLELKRGADSTTASGKALEQLQEAANRNGTSVADCQGCGERLQVGLLTEAACPHCGHDFRDIERPSSILRRFKSPVLTGTQPSEAEPDDGFIEDNDE